MERPAPVRPSQARSSRRGDFPDRKTRQVRCMTSFRFSSQFIHEDVHSGSTFMSAIMGDYVAGFLGSSEGCNWEMKLFDVRGLSYQL